LKSKPAVPDADGANTSVVDYANFSKFVHFVLVSQINHFNNKLPILTKETNGITVTTGPGQEVGSQRSGVTAYTMDSQTDEISPLPCEF
jgi:hypothetical protein